MCTFLIEGGRERVVFSLDQIMFKKVLECVKKVFIQCMTYNVIKVSVFQIENVYLYQRFFFEREEKRFVYIDLVFIRVIIFDGLHTGLFITNH